MNFNENNILAKLYKLNNRNELTNDFCKFFRGIIIYLLLLPVTWPSYIIKSRMRERVSGFRILFGIFSYVGLLILIGAPVLGIIRFIQTGYSAHLIMGFMFWIYILVIGLMCILASITESFSKTNKLRNLTVITIFRTKYKSLKENYCPKINWK